jgi:hypothetical protein
MKQKMKEKKIGNKHKEFINAVATTNNSHLVENKRESDKCKELMKINKKCLGDMMHQSRENEKLMKNIQIQTTEVKQAINQIKPGMQYQQNHSSQFVDKSNQGAQQTPPYILIITRVSSPTDINQGKKHIVCTVRQEVEPMPPIIPKGVFSVQTARNASNVKELVISHNSVQLRSIILACKTDLKSKM